MMIMTPRSLGSKSPGKLPLIKSAKSGPSQFHYREPVAGRRLRLAGRPWRASRRCDFLVFNCPHAFAHAFFMAAARPAGRRPISAARPNLNLPHQTASLGSARVWSGLFRSILRNKTVPSWRVPPEAATRTQPGLVQVYLYVFYVCASARASTPPAGRPVFNIFIIYHTKRRAEPDRVIRLQVAGHNCLGWRAPTRRPREVAKVIWPSLARLARAAHCRCPFIIAHKSRESLGATPKNAHEPLWSCPFYSYLLASAAWGRTRARRLPLEVARPISPAIVRSVLGRGPGWWCQRQNLESLSGNCNLARTSLRPAPHPAGAAPSPGLCLLTPADRARWLPAIGRANPRPQTGPPAETTAPLLRRAIWPCGLSKSRGLGASLSLSLSLSSSSSPSSHLGATSGQRRTEPLFRAQLNLRSGLAALLGTRLTRPLVAHIVEPPAGFISRVASIWWRRRAAAATTLSHLSAPVEPQSDRTSFELGAG